MTIKILFIASNPSNKSPDNSAMHKDTKSRKTIDGWLSDVDADVYFCNIIDEPTTNNKSVSKKQIIDNCTYLHQKILNIKYDYLIALGNNASFALDYLKIDYIKFPHPSGLNIKLNEGGAVDRLRICLRKMIEGKNIIEIIKTQTRGE